MPTAERLVLDLELLPRPRAELLDLRKSGDFGCGMKEDGLRNTLSCSKVDKVSERREASREKPMPRNAFERPGAHNCNLQALRGSSATSIAFEVLHRACATMTIYFGVARMAHF